MVNDDKRQRRLDPLLFIIHRSEYYPSPRRASVSRSTMPRRRFAGHDRQVGSLGQLVDAVERFDALGGVGVREIAAEQQLVDHAILVGRDQRVVRLPGPAEQAADVGEDVGVLAEHADRFVDPGLAELGDDDPQLREAAGHFVQQVGPAEFELGVFGELAAGMDQDRHAQPLGLGIDAHGAAVGRVEILVGRGDGEPAQLQIVLGGLHLARRASRSVGSMPAKPISFCGNRRT